MNHLEKLLDKAFEEKTPAELVNAPVDALQGVSKADADALKASLGIKTIGDLARNKYVRAAQAITHLADLAGK
jgi:nucleotidyltransferase/DNA polymerase involved in DNA repair